MEKIRVKEGKGERRGDEKEGEEQREYVKSRGEENEKDSKRGRK